MTRLLVSTTQRYAPAHEPSGFLYVIDLEAWRIIQRATGFETPFREYDINLRGGMRGLRGICVKDGEIAFANYATVFCFDTHWNLTRTFTSPLCSSIHEYLLDGDGIIITSTVNDHLLFLDVESKLIRSWCIHTEEELTRAIKIGKSMLTSCEITSGKLDFRDIRNFKMDHHDRAHLNSLCRLENGDVLVSLGLIVNAQYSMLARMKEYLIDGGAWNHILDINRKIRTLLGLKKKILTDLVIQPARWQSAVVRLTPNGRSTLLFKLDNVINPNHTVRVLPDGTGIYLGTSFGSVIHFDVDSGKILASTEISDLFLRGGVHVAGEWFAIGAGNQLLLYDIHARKVLKNLLLSDNPNESVHGLDILPPEFDLPPDSFEEKFGRISGFDGAKILWS